MTHSDRALMAAPPVVESLERRQLCATDITVTTHRQQTMDGFGTSLGGYTDEKLTADPHFQKAYFQDLGASMFRVALNPWNLRGKSKHGVSMGTPVVMTSSVNHNLRQFDWNNGWIQNYGRMAMAAKKYGSDVKIIGSFWSPPYWMKGPEYNYTGIKNGQMPTFSDKSGDTAGGSLVDTDANLTQFGRYIAAYVAGFQKTFGVKMYAVSIQNELVFHEWYSSCVYTPAMYVKALKAARRWMDQAGLQDVKIAGPEDVGVGSETNPGLLERQMTFVKAVWADPDATKALAGYMIHGYAGNGINSDHRSPDMWSRYWNGHTGGTQTWQSYPGLKTHQSFSWVTEASGNAPTWAGAMELAGTVQDAVTYGNVSAYVYWGISAGSYDYQSLTKGTDYGSTRYVAFKHFSQMVRPGAVRLDTKGGSPRGVNASVYRNDKQHDLTTVVMNETGKKQILHLDVSALHVGTLAGYLSSEHREWRRTGKLRVHGGVLTFTLPARSLMTLQGALPTATVSTGSVRGVYFQDNDKNGKQDASESGLRGDRVFVDLNGNGRYDKREPAAITGAYGTFTITGLPPGKYTVRNQSSTAYSTDADTVTVTSGRTTDGVLIAVYPTKSTPTPTPRPTKASLSGVVFSDENFDGKKDPADPAAPNRVVFLDANNNGTLDASERSVTSDSGGTFTFGDLSAGTYHVRRIFPAGYTYSTTLIDLTLTSGEQATGLLIGSKPR